MFHLAGHQSTVNSATLAAGTALADQALKVNGNDIYIPAFASKYGGSYVLGTTVTLAQVVTPSMRQTVPIDISIIDTNATPQAAKSHLDRAFNLIDLVPNETFDLNIATSGSAATWAFHWFFDAAVTPVTGKIFTVRFTMTGLTGANTWANQAITLSNQLPVGRYQCVGASFQGNNLLAGRFVPIGYPHRPGTIALTAIKDLDVPEARFGKLGVWFEFDELTLPSVDLLASGATGAIVGYMDLIKIS